MAGTARQADFLHLHANVSRRVRNLETGVHPVSVEGDYGDVPPTAIAINTTKWTYFAAGTANPAPPMWQRRSGIVTLMGGIEPASSWAAISAEEPVGTLPAGARPLSELLFTVAANAAPHYATIRVETDGTLSVIKPAEITGTTGIRFDGANWTID